MLSATKWIYNLGNCKINFDFWKHLISDVWRFWNTDLHIYILQWRVDIGRHQTVLCGCWERRVEVWYPLWSLWYSDHHTSCHILQHKEKGTCKLREYKKWKCNHLYARKAYVYEWKIFCEHFASLLYRLIGWQRRWGRLTLQCHPCTVTWFRKKGRPSWKNSDQGPGKDSSFLKYEYIQLKSFTLLNVYIIIISCSYII